MKRVVVTSLAGLCLAVWLLWQLAGCAVGHEAQSGFQYPYSCCGNNDCAEIPSRFVKVTQRGFEIRIPPGGHPTWTADRTEDFLAFFSHEAAAESPDGNYHICILPYTSPPRAACFWRASFGS